MIPKEESNRMKTPKEYNDNIKKGIITSKMLTDCLYSVNKRAKNWRDKERDWRNSRYDNYNNEEKAREKKQQYYDMKDTMLSIVQPHCIHRETIVQTKRERIYDYDDEYWEYKETGKFIHEGKYWDRELQDYVEFGDVSIECDPRYHYYLFYDLGNGHTFHTPINDYDLELNDKFQVVDINQLITPGHDIESLVSTQFVKKVLGLIESEEYQYVQ